jgi:fatty acid desaturase
MLRSFPEHRAVGHGTRSAVVRTNVVGRLLFLNNNLHHTHHTHPGVAWYDLPAAHEALGGDDVARAGAGWYRGYLAVARRHLFQPLDDLVQPAWTPPVVTALNGGVEPAT